MRAWILFVGASAALAACGGNDEAGDNLDLNRSLTAQNIVANDVTAIDAVTGDAANMAEDVDFTEELANELQPADGNRTASASRPRRPSADPARRTPPRPTGVEDAPQPATEPAGNATE